MLGLATYGRDRFVAMTAKTDSSTAETAVSYDGITWYAGSIEPESGQV